MQRKTKMKRKPNFSLIQTSRCYTVGEAAKRLDRTVHTVRSWIKQGLPVLPDTSPRLIDGAELKAWLKTKWTRRKRPCGVGELFCCKCCQPRAPHPKSVNTAAGLGPTTVRVTGKCGVCGTLIQQVRKLSELPEILAEMRAIPKVEPDLIGYRDRIVKPTLWHRRDVLDTDGCEGGSDSVH